jgi:hypothetical protein
VKVRVAKVAAWSWVVGAVKMSRRVSPTKSWTSSKRKGEVSVGVFARAEEEEEGQDNHVSHRAKGGISAREPGKMSYPAKNLDGDRFDTIWSRISFLPRCPSPL